MESPKMSPEEEQEYSRGKWWRLHIRIAETSGDFLTVPTGCNCGKENCGSPTELKTFLEEHGFEVSFVEPCVWDQIKTYYGTLSPKRRDFFAFLKSNFRRWQQERSILHGLRSIVPATAIFEGKPS